MKLGVAIPQFHVGGDPHVMREFAQTAEAIGYSHLALYDHVVGINIANRPNWKGPYHSGHVFHDVFVLFGYLAAHTQRLELSTHVLILPQRQTVLVAKQAASVDYLSGGRLRLGIGLGWNPVEYTALGENFKNRGLRSAEQVEVLKALWTNANVTYKGQWHDIPDVGLNPLPIQRPIPVWFGGHVEQTFDRIARLGDGWITLQHLPDENGRAAIEGLRAKVRAAGRTDSAVGIDAWISIGGRTPAQWRDEVKAWRDLGVTHVTLNTTFGAFHHRAIEGQTLAAHLDAIREFHNTVVDLL
jgi:probable F420-dependent oxidoreductase